MAETPDAPTSIPALVDSPEAAPEALRPFYAPVTEGADKGKYALRVAPVGGWSLEPVQALKSSLLKERDAAGKLAAQLKSFEGLEPDAARKALEIAGSIDKMTPNDKVQAQIESAVSAIKANHAKEVGGLKTTLEARETAIRQLAIQSVAAAAISKMKGDPELLMPHIMARAQVQWVEGQPVPKVYMTGDDGKTALPTMGAGAEPMGVGEYVEKVLAAKFPVAFGGHGGTGGGATGGGAAAGGAGTNGKRWVLTPEEAKNPAVYRRVMAEAQKAGLGMDAVEIRG